jgi:ribosomal protein S18 acetylase RimI-like enzyme
VTTVVPLQSAHHDALLDFFRQLPEGDLTFIKENVVDPDVIRAWTAGDDHQQRWIALGDDGDVRGYVAVRRLPGWSDHVGEVRLVVAQAARGTGLGRDLARHALVYAVEAGMTKLLVEVVAEQGAALALFTALGFTGEALLRDQIRGRDGQLRDLMVLAHHVGDVWTAMDSVGLPDALEGRPR